jgi:hypothetical protein
MLWSQAISRRIHKYVFYFIFSFNILIPLSPYHEWGSRLKIPLKAWNDTSSFFDIITLSILVYSMVLPSESIKESIF